MESWDKNDDSKGISYHYPMEKKEIKMEINIEMDPANYRNITNM